MSPCHPNLENLRVALERFLDLPPSLDEDVLLEYDRLVFRPFSFGRQEGFDDVTARGEVVETGDPLLVAANPEWDLHRGGGGHYAVISKMHLQRRGKFKNVVFAI